MLEFIKDVIECQIDSIIMLLSDSSQIFDFICAFCFFWIPIDVMFIGTPMLLIYLIYKVCKNYFKYVVK